MKKFIIFFLAFINCFLCLENNHVVANADTSVGDNIIINQSVDEDLEEFGFDWERYCVGEDRFYQPIMINFRESLNEDSYDLIYFYNLDDYQPFSVKVDIYVGNDSSHLTKYESVNYELIPAGVNDKFVYRYAINGFENYRHDYRYRRYYFNTVYCSLNSLESNNYGSFVLNNAYQFDKNNTWLEYSNCINVILEDAHCWSWHFDEDNGWDNFWEWFGGNRSDVLKDQLFYSFYISNWDVSEIKSIDLQYKKALLEGYRYNIADIGNESEFYDNADDPDGYAPKFYKWNDNNSKDSLDKSNLLGYSKKSIANKIDYVNDTINPTSKTSVGVQHNYTWDSIMNLNEFKTQFGEDSNIYEFASGYFTSKENKDDYWIINFDEFYYSFQKATTQYRTYHDFYLLGDVYPNDYYNVEFNDYLESYDVPVYINRTGMMNYCTRDYYHFTQEYVFDMRALQITFEDSLGLEYTLPTSVSPVDEEASGGGSEFFWNPQSTDWLKELLRIIGIACLIIALIFFWPFIKIALDAIVLAFKAVINFFKKLFSKKEKKNEKKNE